MAYSAIANSEIAVGAPITNNLMTKLRDNPEEIATGGSGATKVVYSALNLSGSIVQADFDASLIPWVEMDSSTASNPTVTADPNTYDIYKLIIWGVDAASGTPDLILRMGNTTVDTGNNYYYTGSGAVSALTLATGAATGDYIAGEIDFYNPGNTSYPTLVKWRLIYLSGGTGFGPTEASDVGYWNSSNKVDKIQLLGSGGGTFNMITRLYGIKV